MEKKHVTGLVKTADDRKCLYCGLLEITSHSLRRKLSAYLWKYRCYTNDDGVRNVDNRKKIFLSQKL